MKQKIITEVVQQMLVHLDNAQLQQLQKVLEYTQVLKHEYWIAKIPAFLAGIERSL